MLASLVLNDMTLSSTICEGALYSNDSEMFYVGKKQVRSDTFSTE